jgi:hypothetical protein
MPRALVIALVLGLPALLVALYVVARRDPRYTPSPLHRAVDPIALSVMMLGCIAAATYLLVTAE